MDEKRFHHTFEVVKATVVHGVGLHWMDHTVLSIFIAKELVNDGEVVQDRVD